MKKLTLIVFCVLAVCIGGCKKKTLHFNKVTRIDAHTGSRLNKVQFIGNNTYIAVGGEKFEKAEVVRSTDGGETWTVNSYPDVGKGFYGMCFSPQYKLYLTGFDNILYVSSDGGEHWESKVMSDWQYYVGVSFAPNGTGVVVTTEAQKAGVVMLIDSNAKTISKQSFGFGFNDVCMVDNSIGYATGYGAIVKTTDGGNTWTILNVKDDNFMAIDCHGTNEAWVCGNNGSILHTTDGGSSWKRLRNGNSVANKRYWLNDILFTDNTHGWAVGDDGVVIYTDDAGENWKAYNKFTSDALRSIALMLDGSMIVCGDNGALYKLEK
ncbi:MAG: hypothetical protein JST82_04060 [Bacteroidetes bacterium]|nr:hypothetical protein [Bacteroidota bacterium]